MNLVDAAVILLIGTAAMIGWRMGLVLRAMSWLFMSLGVCGAALALPSLLEMFSAVDEAWLALTAILWLVAAATAGQAIGIAVSRRIGPREPTSRWRSVDQIGGAITGGVGMILMVWLITPAVISVPGALANQFEDSTVVDAIGTALPEPPDTFDAIQGLVGRDAFPQVFAGSSPIFDVGEPPTSVPFGTDIANRVGRSVVRVQAIACGQRQDGTGFFIGPGLVLTNAHVVAGSTRITVAPFGASEVATTVRAYDPERDLAVLEVNVVGGPGLDLVDGSVGDPAAVLGHPRGGTLRSEPVRIAERVRARGRDLYGDRDISRQVYFMAGSLEPGDSGAPVVNATGEVIGIVFAIAPDDDGVAFALTSQEALDMLATTDLRSVAETQDCVRP